MARRAKGKRISSPAGCSDAGLDLGEETRPRLEAGQEVEGFPGPGQRVALGLALGAPLEVGADRSRALLQQLLVEESHQVRSQR